MANGILSMVYDAHWDPREWSDSIDISKIITNYSHFEHTKSTASNTHRSTKNRSVWFRSGFRSCAQQPFGILSLVRTHNPKWLLYVCSLSNEDRAIARSIHIKCNNYSSIQPRRLMLVSKSFIIRINGNEFPYRSEAGNRQGMRCDTCMFAIYQL